MKRTKILPICFGLTVLAAVGIAQVPTIQQAALAAQARLVGDLPEVTYYNGEVGVEFRIQNSGSTTIGDRELVVVDLDPSLPKLMGGVTDDRAPLSGFLEMNGVLINLTLEANGRLEAVIPQSAFNWYSGNLLNVEVFDGPASADGSPTGEQITGWTTYAGSLL